MKEHRWERMGIEPQGKREKRYTSVFGPEERVRLNGATPDKYKKNHPRKSDRSNKGKGEDLRDGTRNSYRSEYGLLGRRTYLKEKKESGRCHDSIIETALVAVKREN